MADTLLPLSHDQTTVLRKSRRNLLDALACSLIAFTIMYKTGFELGITVHTLALFPGYAGLSKLRRTTRMDGGLSKLFMALLVIPGVAQVVQGMLLFRIHEVMTEGLPPEPAPVPVAAPEPVAAPLPKAPAKVRPAKVKINLAVLPPEMKQLATSRRLVIVTLLASAVTVLSFINTPALAALRPWKPLLLLTGVILGGASLQLHHRGKPLHWLSQVVMAPTLVLPLLNLPALTYLWLRATLTLRRAAQEQARLNAPSGAA